MTSPAREPDLAHRGLAALRPFSYRAFTLLWVAGFISNVGSWMQTVAVGALVIANTGNANWAVLVAASAFLPIGVLAPIGGALADRWPRRPVLIGGNLIAAATALAIALLVATGNDSPGVLVVLVGLQGAASALIGPFQQAILPDLVPRSEFLGAVSLNSAQFNLGRIVGPGLAAGTVAALGYPAAFYANAASFLAVVVVLPFIRLTPPSGESVGLFESLRSGVKAARAEPACMTAIGTIAVVALIASPFIALVPVMAHQLTDGGKTAVAQVTGLLTAAQGVGAVIGALLMAPLANRIGRGRLLAISMALLPVTLLAYASAQTPWWGAVTLFAVGLVYIGVLSGLSAQVQLNAPQEYRGRVLSLFLVALGVAYPIGALIQGPVISAIGIGWTTAASAMLLTLIMVVAVLIRPGLTSSFDIRAAPEAA